MSILDRLAAIAAKAKQQPQPSTPPKTQSNQAENWATTPLSNLQKACICQAAAAAYKAQKYIETPLNEWRQSEQEIACGKSSLCDCNQTHYLSLLAHFQTLAGDHAKAQKTWSKTGRVRGSTILHDTLDNRKVAMAKITEALNAHKARMALANQPPVVTYPYVLGIVKNQHKKPIEDLTATQLQRLLFTVNNRISAKEGVGDSKHRNKSQRRKK